MKRVIVKLIILTLFGLIVYPHTASASWWRPLTWKFFNKENVSESISTSTATSTLNLNEPSVEDLKRRIVELEEKLEDMMNAKKEAEKVAQLAINKVTEVSVKSAVKNASVNTQTTKTSVTGLSEKEIIAKVKPAMVLVETSLGSVSGVLIDSVGNIVTKASVLLKKDSDGFAKGVLSEITVKTNDGKKTKAQVVGVDEANDLAVIKISEKGTFDFIKVNYDAGISEGENAYVFSLPLSSGASIGYDFAEATIVRKTSSIVEINTTKKPFDTGGAIVNDAGGFIGIPNNSSCKVLEEMKNCLKYSVSTNIISSKLPKLLEGMMLYRDHRNRTDNEELFMGQFQGMYSGINGYGIIDYAIDISSGKNSFDNLNSKLSDDMDGKITKLYLNKLKISAENNYRAMELLKSLSYNLRTFMINESATALTLGSYQQKIINEIKSTNETKLKEYTAKVDFWSKKKNEYDEHINNPSKVTHDYLMEEALGIEASVEYLKAERKRILDTFSGENVAIF